MTVVKLEELGVTLLGDKLASRMELGVGAISTELRFHIWLYTLVLVQAAVVFPFLLRVYSVADYRVAVSQEEEEEEQGLELEEVDIVKMSQYESFPGAAKLDRAPSTVSGEVDTPASGNGQLLP